MASPRLRHARVSRKIARHAHASPKHLAIRRTASRAELVREPRAPDSPEEEGEIEGREDWFYFQRAYPFGVIPAEGRRRAWDARPAGAKTGAHNDAGQIQSWRAIGPAPTSSYLSGNWGVTSGRINAIAVSPANSQIVLIGAATGGIWRSTDGGATFAPVTDNQVDLSVGSIAFSRSNPAVVYAGMGDTSGYLGTGVLKSTDAGASWARVSNSSLPAPATTSKIDVDPNDSNRVYLAQFSALIGGTAFSSGFFVSSDGGVNWTRKLAGLTRDFAISYANSQTLYLAMRRVDLPSSGAPGLYRSIDGGNSWTNIYTSPTDAAIREIKVAVTPADPQRVYVYTGDTSLRLNIGVSLDGGGTWNSTPQTTVDNGQLGYNSFIFADPANANTVYVGARDLYKSTNSGASFANLTKNYDASFAYRPTLSNAHPDQHVLAFSTANPGVIYLGNDGGLYYSTNAGASFQSRNSSLALTQFIGITMHPTQAGITYGGTQDNGTQRTASSASTQWQEFSPGDGGHCVVNPLDASMVFTTYIYGSISRFRSGSTFDRDVATNATFGEPDTNPRIAFYAPFVGNGADATLYFGTWKLFTSTDLGNNWSATSATDLTLGGTDVLNAIAVSRSNRNVIYTGSRQGRVMASADGGHNWTDITAGLPARTITGITVDPMNPAIVYLSVSGYGSGHIFKTVNGTAALGTLWVDISGNLPNIPTSAFLIDPSNPNIFYAGTDVGVFRSSVGGLVWETFNAGLPPTVVTAFATNAGGQIQISTYGRGAYEGVTGAASDFSISSTSNSQTVSAGVTASYNIATATTSGSAQALNLSVAGLPAGTSANFNPASVTSGNSSTLTVTTSAQTPVGNYTLTVTASGATTHSVTLTLGVTPSANPIDDARFFVRQHYLDFLNREPDQGGWDYWAGQITQCGASQQCIHDQRLTVSAAFFIELEFQETGYYVYRFYKSSYGAKPAYVQFTADRALVPGGSQSEAARQSFADQWVQRAAFLVEYPLSMSAQSFVNHLFDKAGLTNASFNAQRAQLASDLQSGLKTRAQVLRAVVEIPEFKTREFNPAFVDMQYFGYLHRDSDTGGYNFWLDVLNRLPPPNNFRNMVCAFITSGEYQLRFGTTVTRRNSDCSSQ